MYAWPVNAPILSNRETFTQLVRIWDDMTDTAVNWSGVIGNGVTASAWTVRAGAVLTTSATTFTIPAFPFGGDLSALAIVVPAGLAIVAGNPITITDLSGVNQVLGYVTSYNSTTGALVAQIGCTFQWEVRRITDTRNFDDGYTPFASPGIGTLDDTAPLLTASLANGKILFVEPAVIQIQVPELETRQLGLGTYQMGLVVTDSQISKQVYVSNFPIVAGGVTT